MGDFVDLEQEAEMMHALSMMLSEEYRQRFAQQTEQAKKDAYFYGMGGDG